MSKATPDENFLDENQEGSEEELYTTEEGAFGAEYVEDEATEDIDEGAVDSESEHYIPKASKNGRCFECGSTHDECCC